MKKLHSVSVDGETFSARSGQVLLDAALLGGVELPHDCRAGRCGACLTRVKQGITLGGESHQPGMVHACQTRVFSDLTLEVEPVPAVDRIRGKVMRTTEVGHDIVEVVIAPEYPLLMLAGQYCRFAFRGYPARPFSPTMRMNAIADDGLVRLHVKRVRDGRVTSEIGRGIGPRHSVAIEGPFGHAYIRPGLSNRLVLVATGTGFAPIWAVATAALRENPERRIVIVVGSHKVDRFYMGPALELLCAFANVKIVAAIEELERDHRLVLAGRAVDHLPEVFADDIVYVAGGPSLVDAVGEAVSSVGAVLYCDPFEPVAPAQPSWLDAARHWLKVG